MRRNLFIFMWVVLTPMAWEAAAGGALFAAIHFQRHRTVMLIRSVSDWAAFYFIFYGMFGLAAVALTGGVDYFDVRGRLPGTHPSRRDDRGFEVSMPTETG